MKSKFVVGAVAALALGWSSTAFAAQPDSGQTPDTGTPQSDAAAAMTSLPVGPVHMSVAGTDMVAAAPDGYCDPIGKLSAMTVAMSAWAQRSRIELGAVWVKCDFHVGQLTSIRLAVVGAKADGPRITASRRVMARSVAAALPTAAGQAVVAQSLASGNAATGDQKVATRLAGQPQVAGLDNDAVYILIDADETSQTSQLPFTVVEALTVVKGRLAIVAFAALKAQPEDKAELLANAKHEVKRFIAMNGG